jgi:hypothetical protein
MYINTVFRKGMGSACEIQIFQPYKVSTLKFYKLFQNDCEKGMVLASCPFSKSATECTIRFAKERAYRLAFRTGGRPPASMEKDEQHV